MNTTLGMLIQVWNDLDRTLDGLDTEAITTRHDGGSAFAWTLAHVTNVIDGWINVRFQSLPPHPLIGEARFRMGGDGTAADWEAIQAAVAVVRAQARGYLETFREDELDLVIPYDGSIIPLRATGLSLRYAIIRNIGHHYYHVGEIATKRERMGWDPGPMPGPPPESQ